MPFKFGVDSSGNYGYIKAGADTVTPFLTRTGFATEPQVLSGYTFSNASSSGLTGTMPNINSIDLSISSVYGGGSFGDGIYSRMNAGAHITQATSGYPELFIPQSQIVTAIGLTAAKIVKGNTILGLAGTATFQPKSFRIDNFSSNFTISGLTINSTYILSVSGIENWTSSSYIQSGASVLKTVSKITAEKTVGAHGILATIVFKATASSIIVQNIGYVGMTNWSLVEI